eukprot:2229996-Amphidinium_carterae.1
MERYGEACPMLRPSRPEHRLRVQSDQAEPYSDVTLWGSTRFQDLKIRKSQYYSLMGPKVVNREEPAKFTASLKTLDFTRTPRTFDRL